jgi:hypothetical protein
LGVAGEVKTDNLIGFVEHNRARVPVVPKLRASDSIGLYPDLIGEFDLTNTVPKVDIYGKVDRIDCAVSYPCGPSTLPHGLSGGCLIRTQYLPNVDDFPVCLASRELGHCAINLFSHYPSFQHSHFRFGTHAAVGSRGLDNSVVAGP